MAGMIVNPDEQLQFAGALSDLVDEMRTKQAALADGFAMLSQTWQDQHWKAFADVQGEMDLYLLGFYNRSQLYIDYLRAKAQLGKEYLG